MTAHANGRTLLGYVGLASSAVVAFAVGLSAVAAPERPRGFARAEGKRPKRFPHRVWAACDFEGRTRDYGW